MAVPPLGGAGGGFNGLREGELGLALGSGEGGGGDTLSIGDGTPQAAQVGPSAGGTHT